MPLLSTAEVALPDAEKILFKLCKHYALKVPVRFDSSSADIAFPMGRCQVARTGEVLRMRCEAEDAEALDRVLFIMGEHLTLMAKNKALVIEWQKPD